MRNVFWIGLLLGALSHAQPFPAKPIRLLMFANAAAVTVHVKSGRIKALAVASSDPSALAPGLPTLGASGLAGFDLASNYGIFGPAKMPRAIIEQLNREVIAVISAD